MCAYILHVKYLILCFLPIQYSTIHFLSFNSDIHSFYICSGLEVYRADVEEKMSLGADRIKRRGKTCQKEEDRSVEVAAAGMFIEVSAYQKEFSKDPAANGHQVFSVTDPLTNRNCQAAFVPHHKRGHFEGRVANAKRVKYTEQQDTDRDALRANQVQESFSSNASALEVPQIKDDAPTLSELHQTPAEEPEIAEEAEELSGTFEPRFT